MALVDACSTCGKPMDRGDRNPDGDCGFCEVKKAQERWPETAKRLRRIMREKKITRYNLAKTLSIPLTTMYRYLDVKAPKTPGWHTGRLLVEMIEKL